MAAGLHLEVEGQDQLKNENKSPKGIFWTKISYFTQLTRCCTACSFWVIEMQDSKMAARVKVNSKSKISVLDKFHTRKLVILHSLNIFLVPLGNNLQTHLVTIWPPDPILQKTHFGAFFILITMDIHIIVHLQYIKTLLVFITYSMNNSQSGN